MGVTHKLSPDVIAYIVQLKQSHSGIGCRKLAELVSAHFQINVSKSSVNTVIKNASLSNSVGRPTKKAKDKLKKFQIPSEKKQQISQALQQIPIPDNVQNDNENGAQESMLADSLGALSESSQPQPTQTAHAPYGGAADTNQQKPLSHSDGRSESAEQEEIITMDYAGAIFLLAAFYENMDETVLGSLLGEYNSQAERKEYERQCNEALLMSSLDIKDLAQKDLLLRKHAKFASDYGDIERFLTTETSDIDKILLQTKIDLELSQLRNSAIGFVLTLSSGRSIRLDPYLSSIVGMDSTTALRVPLKAAVDKLSEEVLVNNHFLSFTSRGETAGAEDAIHLMAAFAGVPGYNIEKISVLGDGEGSQLEFAYITAKKRHFVYGVYPTETDFGKYAKASQWASRIPYEDPNGKSWEYCVTRSDYPSSQWTEAGSALTVLTLWPGGQNEPLMALVTNSDLEHKLLLDKLLCRFLALKDEQVMKASQGRPRTQVDSGGDYETIRDALGKFSVFLQDYMAGQYFSTDMGIPICDICQIPGVVNQRRDLVEVLLTTASMDSDAREKLKKAANNVNIRKIYDTRHRLLNFYIK